MKNVSYVNFNWMDWRCIVVAAKEQLRDITWGISKCIHFHCIPDVFHGSDCRIECATGSRVNTIKNAVRSLTCVTNLQRQDNFVLLFKY